MLEAEILSSFVSYPRHIDEFLAKTPLECFSKKAQKILQNIITLNEKGALSQSAFIESLSQEQREDEFVIEVLATLPNPNVANLAQAMHEYYLKERQRKIALRLLEASENNTILEIESLMPQVNANTFKNLAQWREFYDSKPEMPKFNTGIDFLDSVFDGGIECAQLVLISGDPEAGKTTLGLQILENIAKKHKVGFFSFEFPIYQYIKAKREDKSLIAQNLLIIDDGYEIYQVAQNIKNLYKQGVKVFLIDSQMRLVSPNGRNMEEEESLKFSTLARLCHSLGIVVFLIVQTSKGDRDNPMGSKKGGHESSITIRIEHDKAENESLREFSENSRIIILKKNKQTGKHYKEKVRFDSVGRKFCRLDSATYEENLEMEVIPL